MANIADTQLVTSMARLTVSLTIMKRIRVAYDEDGLSEQWLKKRSHAGLNRDANGLIWMRGRLYVLEIPTHSGLK